MLKMDTIPWHTRALVAFQELSDEDRKLILQELAHWWPLPRSEWPAERLVRSRARLDEDVFIVNEHWGIGVRWHEEQAVEITALRRRIVKIVSTEKPKPAWRNPDILLAWAVVAFLASAVFFSLWALESGMANSNGTVDAGPSLGNQIMGLMGWLSLMTGVFLLLRCLFRSR
jgi:hypothetical protein